MKKWNCYSIWAIIGIFIVSIVACDGIFNEENGIIQVFERQPAPGITRNYNDILPVNDGWIAVGRSHGSPLDAIIVKYDLQGLKVWERGFGSSNSLDEFYSIMEITNGYIVRAMLSPVGRGISVVIKFDKDGNLIWAKNLSVNAIAVNEFGFVGIGGIKSNKKNTLFVAQYDVNGNILWRNQIGNDLNLYGSINPHWDEVLNISKIMNCLDGYFLYGNTMSVFPATGTTSEGLSFVAKLSEDGKFLWQRTIEINNFCNITLVNDGIVIAGSVWNDSGRIPYVKKYDFEMELIWKTQYEHNNFIVFQGITKVGEDIFVSIFRSVGGGSFVSGINSCGKRFWNSEISNETHTLYSNIFAIDGGFVVNAYHSPSGKNSFLIFESNTLNGISDTD